MVSPETSSLNANSQCSTEYLYNTDFHMGEIESRNNLSSFKPPDTRPFPFHVLVNVSTERRYPQITKQIIYCHPVTCEI